MNLLSAVRSVHVAVNLSTCQQTITALQLDGRQEAETVTPPLRKQGLFWVWSLLNYDPFHGTQISLRAPTAQALWFFTSCSGKVKHADPEVLLVNPACEVETRLLLLGCLSQRLFSVTEATCQGNFLTADCKVSVLKLSKTSCV